MNSDNQQILFCADDNEYRIFVFVINYEWSDFIKII